MDIEPDEDIIVIHLGRTLPDAEYNAVVDSIVKFMNTRYPDFKFTIPS